MASIFFAGCGLCCTSFSTNNRRRRQHRQQIIVQEDSSSSESHQWNHKPFDFSSRIGWDKFYRDGNQSSDEQSLDELEYEWHAHIPHSVIVDALSPTIDAASAFLQNSNTADTNKLPSILLIGTGNSALPRVLHDAFDTPVKVTCLDYSPVCVEMIKAMYSEICPNMDFVLGDATRLKQAVNDSKYDVIVDKGLLDALMCGEGFDSDLEKLMDGIDAVLTRREWGISILICFQLSTSSKQSLVELASSGKDNASTALFWDFDCPVEGSENGRATFNVARRSSFRETGVVDVDHMITNWN